MSYYYNYYIGYIKDHKFYPWGPYDANGVLSPALSRSSSFASDLHDRFIPIKSEEFSDELIKQFEYSDYKGEKNLQEIKYLPTRELPMTDMITHGYFLNKQIDEYERNDREDAQWIFDAPLSGEEYVRKLEKQMKFGPNQPQKDIEGNEYTEPNASDYTYYAFLNTSSVEYEAHILMQFFDSLVSYSLGADDWVILETEG